MGMCIFYRTATMYLTRHLSFVNELLYDLVILHPLMLKEDQSCQVIHITAKKLSQIIRQDYAVQLTDEWKIYQGQEIPEDSYITGHQEDGSNTYWKRVFGMQNSTGSPHYYVLPKNSKILTSERSLLSDNSINAIRLTKHAI